MIALMQSECSSTGSCCQGPTKGDMPPPQAAMHAGGLRHIPGQAQRNSLICALLMCREMPLCRAPQWRPSMRRTGQRPFPRSRANSTTGLRRWRAPSQSICREPSSGMGLATLVHHPAHWPCSACIAPSCQLHSAVLSVNVRRQDERAANLTPCRAQHISHSPAHALIMSGSQVTGSLT